MRVSLLLAICLGAAAPAADAPQLLGQIRSLIADTACTSHAECRTLALGVRACGGPEAYLPWSTARTDERKLAPLAAQYKSARAAQIAAAGELSDCRMLSDPGATCQAGRCQLAGPDPS